MKNLWLAGSMDGLLALLPGNKLMADEVASLNTRYGLFNRLDHRSSYGRGVFPEPFLIDDTDLERNEVRLDWLRTAVESLHSDEAKAEFEKGFDQMTVELAVLYECNVQDGVTTNGMANIEVAMPRLGGLSKSERVS